MIPVSMSPRLLGTYSTLNCASPNGGRSSCDDEQEKLRELLEARL